MFLTKVVCSLVALAAPVWAQRKPIAKLTACELLKQPSKFNGSIIEVRGIYHVGGHGLFLKGEDCEGILVTKGKRWESVIWVVNNREETERRGLSVEGFKNAELELGMASSREMRRHGFKGKITTVTVTYVALFETHTSFDSMIGVPPDDKPVDPGFGDQNIAPGQLFIYSVKDIKIKF